MKAMAKSDCVRKLVTRQVIFSTSEGWRDSQSCRVTASGVDLMRNKAHKAAVQKAWYHKNKHWYRQFRTDYSKAHREKYPSRYKAYYAAAHVRLREKLFAMYGSVCALCNFSDRRALSLDHINQGGTHERKQIGAKASLRKAANVFRPDLYRTLCMNCQFIMKYEMQKQVCARSLPHIE